MEQMRGISNLENSLKVWLRKLNWKFLFLNLHVWPNVVKIWDEI